MSVVSDFLRDEVVRVQALVDRMPVTFDSHYFLRNFAKEFEVEYISLLHDFGAVGAFQHVHAQIGRFLSEQRESLGIESIGRGVSQNIFGSDNDVEKWRRTRLV